MKIRENRKIISAIYLLAVCLIGILLFLANRGVPFMMDDDWYSTNLATGAPLSGFGDVIESQIWHYNNWGGRVITHGLLQLILMTGNAVADIFNTLITLVLAFVICRISRKNFDINGSPAIIAIFLFALSGLFAFNPNIKMSMLWEAGSVNYVYSTVWILCFLCPYLRAVEDPESPDLRLVNLWMIPLSLISGWSNENMGPTCFVIALTVILIRVRADKKPVKAWMIIGLIGSLIGSILCILAPGNFVRVNEIDKLPLSQELINRILSMLRGIGDFLFPSLIILGFVMIAAHTLLSISFDRTEGILLFAILLSYGAMILSPHYPDRASFGTMVLTIATACRLMYRIGEKDEKICASLIYGMTIMIAMGACIKLCLYQTV